MDLILERVASPIGAVVLASDGSALLSLEFADHEDRMRGFLRKHYGSFGVRRLPEPTAIARRVAAYFAGEITALEAIPVTMAGTAFQRHVWVALREIRPGSTISYAELARRVGVPRSIRAVGAANGANPISLVVPCHRVIGSDGGLVGYGGGLVRKAWLIRHESEAGSEGR